MRPPAEDGDADPFKVANDQLGVVPRDAGMRKAGQVGVIDGHALHSVRQMAKARAKDQPQPHRGGTRARPDQGGKLSAL